jgi:TonB family protein
MMLIDIVMRSSIVIAVAIAASMAFRHRSAALRHRVIAAGVFAAVAVIPLSLVLPAWNVRLPASDFIDRAGLTGTALTGSTRPIEPTDIAPSARPGARSEAVEPLAIEPIVLGVWAAGTTIFWALLATALVRLARITRTSTRFEDPRWIDRLIALAAHHGVAKTVALLDTGTPDVLATWGWHRPRILLPADCESWSDARINVVLSHELAHVARADWSIQLAAECIRAVFWFNPLFWIACARLRRDSELACDMAVVAGGASPNEYASELLDIARTCRPSTSSANAAMSMARLSTLEWRITAMLNTTLARAMGTPRARAIAVAALIAVTIPIATFRAFEQVGPLPLTGQAFDVSGAVLPGVAITLEDVTGARRETVTDRSGRFEFDAVAAGNYFLATELPGFRSLRQQLTLRTARNWVLAMTLQVGTVQETVSVSETAPDVVRPVSPAGPYRVGGNIKPPRKIRDVRPVYPQSMRDAGHEGVVPMEAVIGIDGTVMSLRVQSTQVHPELANAAMDAVRDWQFTPTLLNGVAVEVAMTVTVQFRLP